MVTKTAFSRTSLLSFLAAAILLFACPSRSHGCDGNVPDQGDNVFLMIETNKTRAYVNEMIPLTIKLYSRGVRFRNMGYPELGNKGLIRPVFEEPVGYKEFCAGREYEVLEFRTQVACAETGKFVIGPAIVKADAAFEDDAVRSSSSNGFFGTGQFTPIELRSNPASLILFALPKGPRPADFRGAVGEFDLSFHATPVRVKAGNPITLTVSVSGPGNYQTVTAPLLKKAGQFKIYDVHTRQGGNRKTFEQMIVPLTADVHFLPTVSFSFFNPVKGTYETMVRGGGPLTVSQREVGNEDDSPGIPEHSVDNNGHFAADNAESTDRTSTSRDIRLLLIAAIPVVVFFSTIVFKRHWRKHRPVSRCELKPASHTAFPEEAEILFRKNMKPEFYDFVFVNLREYLGNRFRVPAGAITINLEELLSEHLHLDTLKKFKEIFTDCDIARYAPDGLTRLDMEVTLRKLKEAVGDIAATEYPD